MSNKVYPFRKNIGLPEAFEIFTRHTTLPLSELKPQEGTKPFFVLLYGPPGCGKSYSFAHLSEIIPEIDATKAVSISLDALAESVGKFRSKSLEAYGEGNYSKLTGLYTTTIRGSYNNALFNKAPGKPKKGEKQPEKFPTLVDLRIEALDTSIAEGYNIIYERTVSSTKEDILRDEIFQKIKDRYTTYVIFPQVDSVEELESRLQKRVHIMAETKGFARYVPPSEAKSFLDTHTAYMTAYLIPKLATGEIDAIFMIYPSSGTYQKITETGLGEPIKLGQAAETCKGGRRMTRKRKVRKSKKSRRSN